MIDSNKTLCCTINNEFRDSEEVIIQYPSCALFMGGGGNWVDGCFFVYGEGELGGWALFSRLGAH